MNLMKTLSAGVAAVALSTAFATVIATPAMAQQTTSEIRGVVTDAAGSPVSGATITIVDTRTGARRTLTTDSNGSYSARGLTVGGPYSVAVSSTGFQRERIDGVSANLGASAIINFDLGSVTSNDEIVVVASARDRVELAVGPNAAFNQDTLESFPSISRDIRDIIRFDPRVSLDRQNDVDRISCLGGNDRSNTFTVDGVIQADTFGLNGTPFAARNVMPLPFDAVSQTVVEFAPFDVEFGQFTGCNINVVTKSGSNEVHGSAFFNYSSSGLQGTEIRGDSFEIEPYKDYNWGATIGGPVIKDRFFLFAAYEETDDADAQEDGPLGSNLPNEDDAVTLAQMEAISDVLRNVYGIETGGIARSLPQSSRRILARGDFLITDDHRLEFTYQRLRESNIEPDDFGFPGPAFANNFENEGTRSQIYSARLFSQWTDNFSTELRASRSDVQDLQGPVGGGEAQDANPIPRILVGVTNNGENTAVIAGPGLFRSANDLQTQVDQLKAKFDFQKGNHLFTGGYELNQLDVFNLFIADGTGTLYFQDINALIAGNLNTGSGGPFGVRDDNLIQNNTHGATGSFSFSGDASDAAASFSRSIHSIYFQDEFNPTDNLTLQLGLRYDRYAGDSAPLENQNFINRYGFSNAVPFRGLDAIMPRFGFTYDAPFDIAGDWEFRGGAGVFTGGDPTVWFSNAFSNSGNNQASANTQAAGCTAADFNVLSGGQFTGVPQCVIDAAGASATLGTADTQSTDPNLKLSTVIRSNLGFTYNTNFSGGDGFFDNWRVDVDWIFSQFRNPYNFVDLSQTFDITEGLNGFTADGRPIYAAIDPTNAGCNADLQGTGGTPPVFTGVTADCFAGVRRDDEIQLTNSKGFGAHTGSFIMSKEFDTEVFNAPGTFNVSLGYAFTDSQNRRDLRSSRSVSNFDDQALFDRQNPAASTAAFETRHNISIALNAKQEFIKDYPTSLGLFFGFRSGRPFSYTFAGGGDFADSSSGSDNALLYVIEGVNDPLISPNSDANAVAELDRYIGDIKCLSRARGTTFNRNGCRDSWTEDLDLRFEQDLPVPGDFAEDRLTFFVDVDNVLNLIDSGWNVFDRVDDEDGLLELADIAVDSNGLYEITNFSPDEDRQVVSSATVWAVQFGIRYEF